MQFICPLAFCVVQFLLRAIEDNLVRRFSLNVGLHMSYRNESHLASKVDEVVGNLACIKLPTVVKDHCPRDIKMGNNVFPNKLSYLGSNDGCDSLCLYPFSKIIHNDKHIFVLAYGLRKTP